MSSHPFGRVPMHALPATGVRACRVCGCTEEDACVGADGLPCHWVAADLCSACAAGQGVDALAEVYVEAHFGLTPSMDGHLWGDFAALPPVRGIEQPDEIARERIDLPWAHGRAIEVPPLAREWAPTPRLAWGFAIGICLVGFAVLLLAWSGAA